jgi:hypothetical protein
MYLINPRLFTYESKPFSLGSQAVKMYKGTGTKADLDNHSNQMNPNNSAYQSSRENSSSQESTGQGK